MLFRCYTAAVPSLQHTRKRYATPSPPNSMICTCSWPISGAQEKLNGIFKRQIHYIVCKKNLLLNDGCEYFKRKWRLTICTWILCILRMLPSGYKSSHISASGSDWKSALLRVQLYPSVPLPRRSVSGDMHRKRNDSPRWMVAPGGSTRNCGLASTCTTVERHCCIPQSNTWHGFSRKKIRTLVIWAERTKCLYGYLIKTLVKRNLFTSLRVWLGGYKCMVGLLMWKQI